VTNQFEAAPGTPDGIVDDQEALEAADPGGMLRAVASAGAQVRESLLHIEADVLAEVSGDGRPRAVVVAGMGGSGIAADLVAALATRASAVPVVTHRGYRLPGWVGPMDLVVAVSCSGQTAETVAVADEALRRGARVVTVGRAGSPLAGRAESGRAVHLPVDPGGRMPRANLWALTVPVLLLADALGLVDAPRPVLSALADRLDSISAACAPAAEAHGNPAKQLALDLLDTLPCAWGTGAVPSAVAYRFACQLAENAKLPAVHGEVPEAHHNQVVALAGRFGALAPSADDDLFRDRVEDGPPPPRLRLVLFHDTDELPEVARRRVGAGALAEEYGLGVSDVPATGEHPLERLASMVAPADFASVYLALLQGVDPTPIEPIAALKDRVQP
jgi:glucose/mannose-6-phosphate isomerase